MQYPINLRVEGTLLQFELALNVILQAFWDSTFNVEAMFVMYHS